MNEGSHICVALIVLTLNPGPEWIDWLNAFQTQNFRPEHLLVIDSSSQDGYPEKAASLGFQIRTIPRDAFSHGGTRQWAVDIFHNADIVVFMTQDAIFADPESLSNLIMAFRDPDVGAAFGRQLPRKSAGPIEAHARIFNYPPVSKVKSIADARELGVKTAFFSNSFGAYRRAALVEVGGFPADLSFCEDVYASSKLLEAGWKIAYVSDATVFHSHHYSYGEEFRRYVSIGTFYGQEKWITETFGKTRDEGRRYVFSELRYLIPRHIHLLPSALVRTALKLVGYRIGMFRARMTNRA